MEWPNIVPNFLNQQTQEGINYTALIGLGTNQHQNHHHHHHHHPLVNFDTSNRIGVLPNTSNNRYAETQPAPPAVVTSSSVLPSNHGLARGFSNHNNNSNASSNNQSESHVVHNSSRPFPRPEKVVVPSKPAYFECDGCDERFEHEEMLTEHLRHYHKETEVYPCHICNEKFAKKSLLQHHHRRQHNIEAPRKTKVIKLEDGLFGCAICDATFDKLFKAYNHRLRHFPKRHTCNICDQSFYELKNLKQHLEKHSRIPKRHQKPMPDKKFGCDLCPTKVSTKSSLKIHQRVVHQGIKPYNCHVCSRGYWKLKDLQGHCSKKHQCEAIRKPKIIRDKTKKAKLNKKKRVRMPNGQGQTRKSRLSKHAAFIDQKFLCEHCSHSFTSRNQFEIHLRTHMDDKAVPCWLCDEHFESEELMNGHLKDVHNQTPIRNDAKRSENGLYECADCDESFAKVLRYYHHRLKYHDDKRITCSVCGKGFVEKLNYKTHLNTHSGAKPYACGWCKVSFAARANLNIHIIRSHYRFNPLWCSPCNKIFATQEAKDIHKMEHEGKFPFMCEKCYRGFNQEEEEDYKSHLSNFHKPPLEKKYACHYCRRSYAEPRTLKKHYAICRRPRNPIYACKFCPRSYSNFSSLRKHYTWCTQNVEKWIPPKREPRIKTKDVEIPENVSEIEVKEDFVCKVCFSAFPDKDKVEEHVTTEHPNNNLPQGYVCCLRNKDEPRDYEKTDDVISKEPEIFVKLITFFCEVCMIPYYSMSLLTAHVGKYHSKFNKRIKELIEETAKCHPESVESSRFTLKSNQTEGSSTKKSVETDVNSDSEDENSKTEASDASEEEENDNVEEEVEADHGEEEGKEEELENESDSDEDYGKTKSKKKATAKVKVTPTRKSARLRKSVVEFNEESNEEVDLQCKVCNISYARQFYLTKHIEKYHPNYPEGDSTVTLKVTSNKLQCKICKTVYVLKTALEKHIEQYHSHYPNQSPEEITTEANMAEDALSGLTKYKCPICPISYTKENFWVRHMEQFHPDYKDKSQKETLSAPKPTREILLERAKFLMSRKENQDENGDKKTFQCKLCKIEYKKLMYLEKHIDKWHPDYHNANLDSQQLDTFDYYCELCLMPYLMQSNLINHYQKYHPDYYEEYIKARTKPDTKETGAADNQDSNATEIVEAQQLQTKSHTYSTENQLDNLENSNVSVNSSNSTSVQHQTNVVNQNLTNNSSNNVPAQHVNNHIPSHNSGIRNLEPVVPFNHTAPPTRNNCLYQGTTHNMERNSMSHVGATHPIENRNTIGNVQQPTGFQNCYMQQHHIAHHANNSVQNNTSHAHYPTYQNPCDGLGFLDNHPPPQREAHMPNQTHHTRVEGMSQPSQPNAGGRNVYFDISMNNVTDFSYWDRVIGQPQNVLNNPVAPSYGMDTYGGANAMTQPTTLFNSDQTNVRPLDNNPSFQNLPNSGSNNAPVNRPTQDSDGDDPFDIPDTGFAINYDSDSCDDPKVKEQSMENKDTSKTNPPTEEKGGSKFEDQFLQFSKANAQNDGVATQGKDANLEEVRRKAFFCAKCPMYYLRDHFLSSHIKKEHPEYWKEYELEKAVKIANSNNFAENTVNEDGKPIPCKICSETFDSHARLLKHYTNSHIDHADTLGHIEVLVAAIKYKNTPAKSSADRFTCEFCSKTFVRELYVKNHIKIVHMKIKPFQCTICSQSFSSLYSRQRHEAKVHNEANEGAYVCFTCNANFKSTTSLLGHQRITKCVQEDGNQFQKEQKKPKRRTFARTSKKRKSKGKVEDSSSENEGTDEEEVIPPPSTRTRKARKVISFIDDNPSDEELEKTKKVIKKGKRGRKPASSKKEEETTVESSISQEKTNKAIKVKIKKIRDTKEDSNDVEAAVTEKEISEEDKKQKRKAMDEDKTYKTGGKSDKYFHKRKIVKSMDIALERLDLVEAEASDTEASIN